MTALPPPLPPPPAPPTEPRPPKPDPIAVPLSIYEIPHGALILVVARVEALVDATPATEAWNGEPIPAQPAALRCATIGPNPSPFWVGAEDLAGARLFLEVRS